jgi:hypothetical protein
MDPFEPVVSAALRRLRPGALEDDVHMAWLAASSALRTALTDVELTLAAQEDIVVRLAPFLSAGLSATLSAARQDSLVA